MKSIRSRLILWVMGLVLLTWTAVIAFTWWSASSEIHRVFDAQLAQVAEMLALTTLHETEEQDLEDFVKKLDHQDYQYPVVFQIRSTDGKLLLRGPDAPQVPFSAATGAGYSNLSFDGREWRVYTLFVRGTSYQVQVASALGIRHELILKFVLNILRPLLFLFPLVGLFWLGIDRALAPLRWVAREIAGRDQWNFRPLSTRYVPAEVSVLVNEINALLSRLQSTIDHHSRFAANAAHELRTPLAGAMTQLQLAMDPRSGSVQRKRALEQTLKGLNRLNHRVDQLLILACVEPEQVNTTMKPLELGFVAAEVVAELSTEALGKGVEIELRSHGPAMLDGNRELVEILIRNLLTNAIQAVSGGGKVTLHTGTTAEGACLSLEDSGPGIPEDELDRVFNRYHRILDTPRPGSGLGLSIVQAIAEAHGAKVRLSNRERGSGLVVTVLFSPHFCGYSNKV